MKKVVLTAGAVLRGDDAAGPYLAKLLQDNPVEGIEVIDGGQTPEDDLGYIRKIKVDELVLFDAASMELAPGEMRILQEEDVFSDYMMTTHSLPLSFLIAELKNCCKSVIFVGIQPAHTDFMGPLTPQVKESCDKFYDILKNGEDVEHSIPGI